jgi:hypothetical protein
VVMVVVAVANTCRCTAGWCMALWHRKVVLRVSFVNLDIAQG